MLETIREFAADRLTESGEEQAARRAHAAFFLAFAEQRAGGPLLPTDQRGLAELMAEDANLQAALVWLETHGEGAALARLVAALGGYWWARGRLHEGRAWLERALTDGAPAPAAVRARSATVFGLVLLMQGDHRAAGRWLNESLALSRQMGDPLGETQALVGLGLTVTAEQEYDRATAHYEDALVRSASIDDPRAAASLAGSALANLGVVARFQGRLATAAKAHVAALAKHREARYVRGEALSSLGVAAVAREQGDLVQAFAFAREALRLAWDHDELHAIIEALELVADTAVRGDEAAAIRLFAAAERLSEQTGIGWWAPASRARHEQVLVAARAALGEPAFAAAWAAGRAVPLEQAVAEALELTAAPPAARPVPLTPREHEVLRLLVAGKSDREIGEALFISVRTAEGHVAHLLTKLGARTRSEAIQAATAAGLAVQPATDPLPRA
jgi:non-specific serine/threonine protein kinase